MGNFSERLGELKAQVRGGSVVGSVKVDQVYAHYQHERLDLNHPRGGQAKYLETPLHVHAGEIFQHVADTLLDDGGKRGMANAMEMLSDSLEVYAPILYYNLRRSGHPMVKVGGATTYNRAPKQRRLTEAELRQLRRSRRPEGDHRG